MINFKSVGITFPNGCTAFTDLSFQVQEGELAIITGPSGSGKTTIMNLLLKEHNPTQGKIEFAGQALHEVRPSKIPQHRRRIGVVFQDYKLIQDLNVWENIALPLSIKGQDQVDIERRVTDLLKLVKLKDKALLFPKQLSGGEAQRISIARALATGPKVIFADEPTGNLDEQTSLHIIKLLTKINKLGTTVLVATHDHLVIENLKGQRIDLSAYQEREEATASRLVQDFHPAQDGEVQDGECTSKAEQATEAEDKDAEDQDKDKKAESTLKSSKKSNKNSASKSEQEPADTEVELDKAKPNQDSGLGKKSVEQEEAKQPSKSGNKPDEKQDDQDDNQDDAQDKSNESEEGDKNKDQTKPDTK
jgi:cell division transport system ATP-binding protein